MFFNRKEIAAAILKWCTEKAVKKIDVGTIQGALKAGIAKLRSCADQTSTPVDDWIVDTIESWVEDTAKIEQIRAFLVEKLNHIYAEQEGGEYKLLAESLTDCKDGVCCSPAGSEVIGKILDSILGSLLEYFMCE